MGLTLCLKNKCGEYTLPYLGATTYPTGVGSKHSVHLEKYRREFCSRYSSR